MVYTWKELVWLFFCYGFLGWVVETAVGAIRHKRFINRGIVNGPLCVMYGFLAVVAAVFFGELGGFWLFLGCAILAAVVQWCTGRFIARFLHEKWWDYSGIKWNLEGTICLPVTVLLGAAGFAAQRWGNPLLLRLLNRIPGLVGTIILWVLLGIFVADIAADVVLLLHHSSRLAHWEDVNTWLGSISSRLERQICRLVDRRIRRAYPKSKAVARETVPEAEKHIFARGCGFYKILWLFVLGAFLGDIVETIFCRITAGVWMSRSSVVWGPFSLVWGIALGAGTLLLYKHRHRSDSFLFAMGAFLGGAYEYICSVFTEIVFGKVFWDYSHIPFNLGGRINLLYCFFWGIAAVVWIKLLYPFLSSWIEKIPMRLGKVLSWVLVVFFCCNIAVSCMALTRSTQRAQGVPATASWQQIMDERFDDDRIQRIYPNAIATK